MADSLGDKERKAMKNRSEKIAVLLTVVLALSSHFCWATLIENETSAIQGVNDTPATADPIIRGSAIWADAGVMHLASGGGDMDFFSIDLMEGEILMTATTPLQELFAMPDTILGLFDESGMLLVLNDNAGSSDPDDEYFNLGSKIEYQIPEDATYYIGVTGYDDFDFEGNSDESDNTVAHAETGAYALTVAVIPEPATFMLLGLGTMLFLRKRLVFQS